MTICIRSNDLEVRLARDPREIEQAQRLRYRVFFEEMGAVSDPGTRATGIDVDPFDEHADHLIVVDHRRSTAGEPAIVGCYRLLPEPAARRIGGFYSSAEFDLSALVSLDGEILELGRSCVRAEYRQGTVMQLLWRGISQYQQERRFRAMIGCASLPGTDIALVAGQIRYLHERHLAPLAMRPVAHAHRRVAHEAFAGGADYRPSEALRALPPLLKGYLRLGAMIGEGAVLDEAFNTIDVCIVLPTERIDRRYLRHYATTDDLAPAAA